MYDILIKWEGGKEGREGVRQRRGKTEGDSVEGKTEGDSVDGKTEGDSVEGKTEGEKALQ